MPFYEYQCKNCGHTLEAMQKVNDAPLRKCPDCGKSQLTRLMSAPVFRLKGGGWYETDFKGDQDNKKNLADRPEADAPKTESKEDKKPAAEAKAGETGTDAAKPAEKSAEKPVEKAASAETAKKPAGVNLSKRKGSVSAKSKPSKKPQKKAAGGKARR
jgi:putative FmdB family regulatory protein